MGKAPAFQYYAKDHIASKASLTITERGAWSTLVDHCWENGAPISMAVAVRLVGSELLESIRFLLRVEDDTVTFDWIEETRAMQLEKSRKNSENGKLGGRGKSRASKPKSERKANALRNENETKPFRAANAVEVEDIQERKEHAKKTPEDRKAEFVEKCRLVCEENQDRLPKRLRAEFMAYWTEPSADGKMRFEGEKYFDHGRRMDTWKKTAASRGELTPKEVPVTGGWNPRM